jgi:hypothetical protein
MMQTDVKQAHLNSSGYLVKFPTRIKGISFTGTYLEAAAGSVVLFDTASTPVSAGVTYAQTANTVTVTKTAHGLNTGDIIGIHFEANSGVSATDGTYSITKTGADTFTLTDINSRSISSTAAVYTLGKWLMTYEILATDVFANVPFIPGEGVRVETGVYAQMFNASEVQIFYG